MNEHFLRRFIERNATERLGQAMREARFSNGGKGMARFLLTKASLLKRYQEEELGSWAAGELNIPHLQVYVTDQCTFNCKECIAFIPELRRRRIKPYYLEPEAFEDDLGRLRGVVRKIRHGILVGGEVFLHPRLAALIATAFESGIFESLELVTNGALLPSAEVVEVCERYRDRLYIRASEYSNVADLEGRLRDSELADLCREHGLRFQKVNAPWVKTTDFSPRLERREAAELFRTCHFSACTQLWDGKIAVCPKARAGYALGELPLAGEVADLRAPGDLRQDLVDFFARDCFDACRTCSPQEELVPTAAQAER